MSAGRRRAHAPGDGFSLVELVVAILVIALAVTGVLGVIARTSGASGDPLVREQATGIARSYLEAAMMLRFADPNETETGTCEEGGPANRDDYDDVNDYDCIDDQDGPRDQNGQPLDSPVDLSAYNVAVTVDNAADINGTNAKLITVTVTHDVIDLNIVLRSARTAYF